MALTAKRSKAIWDELIGEHYAKKDSYSARIEERLLRVRFKQNGQFMPGRTSAYALTKHPALVKLYQKKLEEERIRLNRGQRKLPF
ncbi:hypothetical protein ACFLT9_12375 [Acidobacteriota bacterium]